jgi:hypothetical protein
MPMPAGAQKVQSLVGVTLYYERTASGDPWGDLPDTEKYGVWMLPSFRNRCEDCFQNLFNITGRPEGIITAGGYVEKPGAHGMARALDLDGIVWGEGKGSWRATEMETPAQRLRYYGIQAHCMLYFGNVLGWEYNAAHKDHLHLDDLQQPLFRLNSKAVVTGIQAMLKYVWPNAVIESVGEKWIDGNWGSATASAFRKVVAFSGQWPGESHYVEFLRKTRDFALQKMKAPVFPVAMVPTQVIASDVWIASVEQRLKALEERG